MSIKALLCINYEQLRALNKDTGDYKLSLLFGRVRFQCGKTRLPNGEIARTKEQMANNGHRGLTATAEDLRDLVGLGLIERRIGMWRGSKRTFISCRQDLDLRLDTKKLALMNNYTGGDMASITLSLMAYWLDINPLHYEDGDWVIVARDQVTSLFDISEKTATAVMRRLEAQGIIKLDLCRRWGKPQYMVKISDDFCNKIAGELAALRESERLEETVKKLAKLEKSDVSIRLNSDPRVDIINNNTLVDETGTIILSKKEQNYLASAVRRTLARCTVLTWAYGELMSHMKYVLTTPKHRNGAANFVHCINRAMLLVREGVWKQPFGYEKYSDGGKSERKRLQALENEHMCDEARRRREENEQRIKTLGDKAMYEKDEDNGNVGAQWKMAREVFKDSQRVGVNSHHARSPITNPIIKDRTHVLVDAGASEFESHGDVMAKLLGRV